MIQHDLPNKLITKDLRHRENMYNDDECNWPHLAPYYDDTKLS